MNEFIIRAGFLILGRAAGPVSKHDNAVAEELSHWKEGFTIKLQVFGTNAGITLSVTNGKYRLIRNENIQFDLKVIIKNARSASRIILTSMSLPKANAQNRIIIEGNTMDAMRFVRTVNSIMVHIYPRFMLKNIMDNPPKTTFRTINSNAKILLCIICGIEV